MSKKQLRFKTMAIYELRNLARDVGIERASELSREELTKAIRKKLGGNDERPVESVLDFNEEAPIYLSLLEESEPSCESMVATENYVTFGYVHMLKHGYALLVARDLMTYKMSATLTSSHKLRMGDYIEAVVTMDKDTKSRIVTEVKSIEKSNFQREGIVASETSSVWGQEIILGSRVIIAGDKTFNRISDMAKVDNSNLYKIALLVDEREEGVNHLCNNGIDEAFLIKVDMSTRRQIALCLYTLFTAKKLASNGKDVLLIVDSLSKIWRIYNNCAAKDNLLQANHVNIHAIADLKNFFLSSKAFKNGGSLTVVSYINKPISNVEQHIYDEFTDLANLIIEK